MARVSRRGSGAAGRWISDIGSTTTRGIDPAKVRALPKWRDSDVYTDLERAVMDYAEAMTATPPEVTDAQAECDLTDAALGLTSQGFKQYCELRPA